MLPGVCVGEEVLFDFLEEHCHPELFNVSDSDLPLLQEGVEYLGVALVQGQGDLAENHVDNQFEVVLKSFLILQLEAANLQQNSTSDPTLEQFQQVCLQLPSEKLRNERIHVGKLRFNIVIFEPAFHFLCKVLLKGCFKIFLIIFEIHVHLLDNNLFFNIFTVFSKFQDTYLIFRQKIIL